VAVAIGDASLRAVRIAAARPDRLWILNYPGNPWFPAELAERMPEVLASAGHQAVADGTHEPIGPHGRRGASDHEGAEPVE
jgi:hypothetical protein